MKTLKFLFFNIILTSFIYQNNFPIIEVTNNTNQPFVVTIVRETEGIIQENYNPTNTVEEIMRTASLCESEIVDLGQTTQKEYRNHENKKIIAMNILYHNPEAPRMILIVLKKGEEIQDGVNYQIWLRSRKLECTESMIENND